jgi:hypothetical protein
MRVLIFRVEAEPEVIEISGGLESMYQATDCSTVQFVPVAGGLDLVCDEEGKLNGAVPNRYVPELQDVICGPFFVTATDGEGEGRDLSDEEIKRVLGLAWPPVE